MSKNKLKVIFALLCFFYFATRLLNLSVLPIFNDESTYIRYGLHQLKEEKHDPYSLLIGKEPLMPYLFALSATTFTNLLISSRIVTVIFGFMTFFGLFLYCKKFINKKAAYIVGASYIFAPYLLFFDRLALLDSPVNAIAIWTLYFSDALLRKNSFKNSFFLGLTVGIGLWIKSSAFFYLFLPIVSYVIYCLQNNNKIFGKTGLQFVGAFCLAILIFAPLYYHPFYKTHQLLLAQYTYPFSFIFSFPFSTFIQNFANAFFWLFFLLTPPLFIFAVFGMVQLWKKNILLFLWFFLPLFYEVLYAKLFTSRHVLLLTIPLLLFAGFSLSCLLRKRRKLGYVLIIMIIGWSMFYNFFLFFNPQKLPLLFPNRVKNDIAQYMYGYPSGYGVKEAVTYLEKEAKKNPLIIVIRNDHGNPEDAIVAYLGYSPLPIKILLFTAPVAQVPQLFEKVDAAVPIYFVSRGAYYAGLEKYITNEKKFKKPNDAEFIGVSRLKKK